MAVPMADKFSPAQPIVTGGLPVLSQQHRPLSGRLAAKNLMVHVHLVFAVVAVLFVFRLIVHLAMYNNFLATVGHLSLWEVLSGVEVPRPQKRVGLVGWLDGALVEHLVALAAEDDIMSAEAFYVMTLNGTKDAPPENNERLAHFLGNWTQMCGQRANTFPKVRDFILCPGILRKRQGQGLTESFARCLATAERRTETEMHYFFEDDARLYNSQFCDRAFRSK